MSIFVYYFAIVFAKVKREVFGRLAIKCPIYIETHPLSMVVKILDGLTGVLTGCNQESFDLEGCFLGHFPLVFCLIGHL